MDAASPKLVECRLRPGNHYYGLASQMAAIFVHEILVLPTLLSKSGWRVDPLLPVPFSNFNAGRQTRVDIFTGSRGRGLQEVEDIDTPTIIIQTISAVQRPRIC